MGFSISTSSILAGFIFGVFGFSFVKVGRHHANMAKVIVGILLMVYPYVVSNDYALWIIGVVLTVVGFKLR